MQALDPGFLPRHPQRRQHQIRLEGQQLLFQPRPCLGCLKAMHGHDQLQARVLLGELLSELLHHSRARPHQGDAPVVLGGMGEQVMGQFDARAAAHPNALAPQGPNHACTIGNHEVSGPNCLPELWLGQRRHRHLGIEGD